jgi:hypothetical protein
LARTTLRAANVTPITTLGEIIIREEGVEVAEGDVADEATEGVTTIEGAITIATKIILTILTMIAVFKTTIRAKTLTMIVLTIEEMSMQIRITNVKIEVLLHEILIRGVGLQRLHLHKRQIITETTEIATTVLVVAIEDKNLTPFYAQKALGSVFCTQKESQIFYKDHPTKCPFVGFYGRKFQHQFIFFHRILYTQNKLSTTSRRSEELQRKGIKFS